MSFLYRKCVEKMSLLCRTTFEPPSNHRRTSSVEKTPKIEQKRSGFASSATLLNISTGAMKRESNGYELSEEGEGTRREVAKDSASDNWLIFPTSIIRESFGI